MTKEIEKVYDATMSASGAKRSYFIVERFGCFAPSFQTYVSPTGTSDERRIWAFAVSETKVASRTLRSGCHLRLLVNAITAKHTPAGATASLTS